MRHLEEAVATIRALWTGGPVSACLGPVPARAGHRVSRPGSRATDRDRRQRRNGARLAARIGDGWTPFDETFTRTSRSTSRRSRRKGGSVTTSSSCAGSKGRTGSRRKRSPTPNGCAIHAAHVSAGRRRAPTAPSSSPGTPPTWTRSSTPPGAGRRLVRRIVSPSSRWPPTPRPSRLLRQSPASCVRCGQPTGIDHGLCEECNPLGLRDASSSAGPRDVPRRAAGGHRARGPRAVCLSGVGPFIATIRRRPAGEGSR